MLSKFCHPLVQLGTHEMRLKASIKLQYILVAQRVDRTIKVPAHLFFNIEGHTVLCNSLEMQIVTY